MRLNAAVLTARNPAVQQPDGVSGSFRQRWPWLGPDLQTLRDTLRIERFPAGPTRLLELPVGGGDRLAVCWDPSLAAQGGDRGLVVLLHGLAGHSDRQGVRRLGRLLQQCGFQVWRLNMRGAGPGRRLAPGTYAAACNRDILPVLAEARRRAGGRPLLGAGLSLGGTVLLNALLEEPGALDGLVCVSSPLDLAACSRRIAAPRNALYSRWLLRRLIAQTLADPGGLGEVERRALQGPGRPRSIRAFDAAITAPRWGYDSVDHYYAATSPLPALIARATTGRLSAAALLVHAEDDPWVPADAAAELAAALGLTPPPGDADPHGAGWQVLITPRGGHNGFHDRGGAERRAAGRDGAAVQVRGSWSDRRAAAWLLERAAAASSGDGPAARA